MCISEHLSFVTASVGSVSSLQCTVKELTANRSLAHHALHSPLQCRQYRILSRFITKSSHFSPLDDEKRVGALVARYPIFQRAPRRVFPTDADSYKAIASIEPCPLTDLGQYLTGRPASISPPVSISYRSLSICFSALDHRLIQRFPANKKA